MTEVEGSIVRHIHRLTMIHIIYLIHCDVINVGVSAFVSATCTRVYGTLTVLTFEFCACCWRDMAFFCSKIVQEST